MKLKYECAICGDEYRLNGFTNHIQRTHKIAYKDYYDKYIEPNTEHICRSYYDDAKLAELADKGQ